MAAGDIWVSFVLNNSSLTVATEIDRGEPAWKAIARGEVPGKEDLPIQLYATYEYQDFTKKLPELFQGGGGTKISPQLEAIFRKFNLGSAWICPAQLFYMTGRHRRIKGSQFLLVGPSCKSLIRTKATV